MPTGSSEFQSSFRQMYVRLYVTIFQNLLNSHDKESSLWRRPCASTCTFSSNLISLWHINAFTNSLNFKKIKILQLQKKFLTQNLADTNGPVWYVGLNNNFQFFFFKYMWMKKCVKIYVILLENWKHMFKYMYQTCLNILTHFYPHIQREWNSWVAFMYEWKFICVDLESV